MRPLTPALLAKMKEKGYRYVQVKPVGHDGRTDYIQPVSIILVPVKDIPHSSVNMEIYELLDEDLLQRWTGSDTNIKVLVVMNG